MSPRVARAISVAIVVVALAGIAIAIPASAIAAREGDLTTIVVVPDERRADIERAIRDGGGCPDPTTEQALADAAQVVCELQGRLATEPFAITGPADPFAIISFVVGMLWITTGYLIISRRGSNLSGWTFQAVGLGLIWNFAALALGVVAVRARPGSVPLPGLWATIGEYSFLTIAMLPMLWLLFPDGQPPTTRWRMWVRIYFVMLAVALVAAVLMPGPLNNLVDFGIIYMNPVGQSWIADIGGALMTVGVVSVMAIAVASVFAVRRRFKRSVGEERQQLRWLRFVITIGVAMFLVDFVGGLVFGLIFGDQGPVDVWFNGFLALLALTLAIGIPAAYLVAIFRYGLWDLDLVIRKTVIVAVVGVTLTAIGVGLLVAVPVLTLGVGATATIGDLMPVIVGVALGLLFGPIRRRARRFADRVVYGQRATPYEVLTSFGERLRDTYAADDVLPRTAQVIAQATGATAAVIWLRIGGTLRPEAVWPPDADVPDAMPAPGDEIPRGAVADTVEVRHQGELLGALSVDMPANDPLDPARRQLLEDLAAQAGLVLRNARLIEELRASRQRLVAAQDEERRRLERNIHDGVQQQLVALSVQLRLAEQLVPTDPARSQTMLAALQDQTTGTLEDLRDLARGIYPPLLADRGLTSALEAQARKAALPTTVVGRGGGPLPARRREHRVLLHARSAQQRRQVRGRVTHRHHARPARRHARVRRARRRPGVRRRRAVDGDRSAGDRRPPRRDRRHVHDRERDRGRHVGPRRGARGPPRLTAARQAVAACQASSRRSGPNDAFGTYDAAPHSAAFGAYSSSSYVERRSTTGGPSAARIRRVASRPSIPGRLTSISTRSGRSDAACDTPSSPVSASPTTSNPSVASTTMRAASRNGSWSSTIKTRTGMVARIQRGRGPRECQWCQHHFSGHSWKRSSDREPGFLRAAVRASRARISPGSLVGLVPTGSTSRSRTSSTSAS